jgi:TRAP-type mannitol/chloroaromatic compound transport system permease large subunit
VAFTLMFLGIQVAFSMMITAVLFGLVIFGNRVVFQFVDKVEDISVELRLRRGAALRLHGRDAGEVRHRRQALRGDPHLDAAAAGRLALATILMCIIFAASSGVIGATESVVGLLTIPIMLRYGYDKGSSPGTICAGGSLGTIIPPSVVAGVMGPARRRLRGHLLYGMVFPGLIMAGLYLVYIFTLCVLRPENGPRIPPEPGEPSFGEKLWITTRNLVPPLFMIFAVLGSILLGWAPHGGGRYRRAGLVGAHALYGRFTLPGLYEALVKTVKITTMIMTVPAGGDASSPGSSSAGAASTPPASSSTSCSSRRGCCCR